ncbi:D-threo-aldose 1-dehydrogenase [Isoptericola sp. CG 20/1183]|uniref:D-threo-aldose 1-dehydrogenase n=1 Tax=Isoptericola halotolerans TaxID=300560 RepID=A0ABX5EJH9_9MICO|nr:MULTISPECIES: aldo/keto reductase [Isoptericola]PRZ09450.1 D-threo-aldose 1-dehydrogenase [Isoptericola sp. CG 20/1183]PRZ10251.1 D-threo-aldose 1-dehydrogenase [Isoptericola halotolerans]
MSATTPHRVPDPHAVPAPDAPGWQRPLPGTGLTVSAVCSGGGPLGSMPGLFGYDVVTEQAVETVLAVLGSPVRFLDTANGYSDGESERRVGLGLAAYRERHGALPDDVVVATKVDPRDGDYSGDRVRRSVDESRERLGLDHLPLVHLHDPENFDIGELTAPGGAVDALVALRDAGEVGAIGLAGGPVPEMRRYLDLGVFDVLLVHNRWTLVDRSAGSLIAAAAERGIGVLNAAVYGGGILAQQTPSSDRPSARRYGYREAPPETLAAVDALRALCTRFGTTLPTAALQFSVRDPRVASTIVGISRPQRVAQTLEACAAPLPEEFWTEAEALLPGPGAWLDGA